MQALAQVRDVLLLVAMPIARALEALGIAPAAGLLTSFAGRLLAFLVQLLQGSLRILHLACFAAELLQASLELADVLEVRLGERGLQSVAWPEAEPLHFRENEFLAAGLADALPDFLAGELAPAAH
jgi:hypothetical protein